MGRRRNQRVPFESSVRIFGIDAEGRPFTRLASTVNVSATGVRVSGLHVPLRVGDIVGVQSGAEKSRYAVVWVGSPGTSRAGELGLRCAEPDSWIWKIQQPQPAEDHYEPPAGREERRRYPRFACDIGFEIKTSNDGPGMYARCTDISLSGCYLETWSPQPVGTILVFTAKLLHGEVRGVATVRSMHPAFGMGLQFLRIDQPELLKVFLEQLSAGAKSKLSVKRVLRDECGSSFKLEERLSTSAEVAQFLHKPSTSQSVRSRVLVAEDSRFLRNAYGHFLTRAGFEVTLAEDGEAVLQIATAQLPDVIILDLLMPKIGGVDALKLLKDDPTTSAIPVIVISSLSQTNEEALVAAGAHCYIEKIGSSPESLPGIVSRVLETRDSQFQDCARN